MIAFSLHKLAKIGYTRRNNIDGAIMKHLFFLPFLLTLSCVDLLKGGVDDPEEEDKERREGERQGDCVDGSDNDEDGDIDCNDSGCFDQPACQGTTDTDTDSDTDSPGDSGTDTGDDTTDDPTDDTADDTDTGSSSSVDPDYLLYTFMAAYEDGELSSATISGNAVGGYFSAILFDTGTGAFCAIDWVFDSSSVYADSQLDSGTVSSFGANVTSWFGFVVTSSPSSRGDCGDLSPNGQAYFDALIADEPGFGFGPLTGELEASMEVEHPSGWSNVEDYVFTGIASSEALSGDGSRVYFAINEGYAYSLSNGTTSWDPSITSYPQGTELTSSSVPTNAFYVGNYYFGLGTQ